MRRNVSSILQQVLLAGLLAVLSAAVSGASPSPALRPAPARPAAAGFPSPSGASRSLPAPRPAPAPGILPAALTGIEQYSVPSSRLHFEGPGVWGMDSQASASDECFLVRWWANAADVDKSGIVLLLSYTLDSAPSRVLNLSRPIPPSARGNQSASFTLPASSSRVHSWRAVLLQRGRLLSILQSPDWNTAP